ncbi:MAG: winged helix-turn-helix transcriptional regulator [Lachnospiraceae bacterium]|nr:winged helix-turn-helix transcriptional regulator [Lachnospiraceae bacterium]
MHHKAGQKNAVFGGKRSPSWVLSKDQIYEAVWKADPEHCGAAVANVVYSLRRKIGDGYIETVVGSGYRFVGAGE